VLQQAASVRPADWQGERIGCRIARCPEWHYFLPEHGSK
jgi:hypothetical protein